MKTSCERDIQKGERSGRIGLLATSTALLFLAASTTPAVAVLDEKGKEASGGATAAAAAPTAPPVSPSYRIAIGDTLEITVLDKPDLCRTTIVLPDGTISYPYLGEVPVSGTTLRAFTDTLRAALAKQLNRPQVTVTIPRRAVREVSALGAVRSPGKRSMGDGWHILDLLADAGGLAADRPEWVTATLVRSNGAEALTIDVPRLYASGDAQQNVALEPGDVLLVQQRDAAQTHVQVLGEVARPGMIPAPRDGSLATILTAVGGVTPQGALSRASILRARTGVTESVDLRDLVDEGKAAPGGVRMEPGDTLVIPKNREAFSVLGAVGRPGAQEYPDNRRMTVLMAVSLAGGISPDAELKSACLIRPLPNGKGGPTAAAAAATTADPKNPAATGTAAASEVVAAAGGSARVIPLDLEGLMGKGKSPVGGATPQEIAAGKLDITIEPGDVVFIPVKPSGGRHGLRLGDVLSALPLIGLFGGLR